MKTDTTTNENVASKKAKFYEVGKVAQPKVLDFFCTWGTSVGNNMFNVYHSHHGSIIIIGYNGNFP